MIYLEHSHSYIETSWVMCKFVNVTVKYLRRHCNNCIPSEANINSEVNIVDTNQMWQWFSPSQKLAELFFRMWIGLIIIFYELNMRRNILLYFCALISIDLVCERKKKSVHVYVRVCVRVFIHFVYEKCEKYRRVMSCHVVSHQDNSEFILKYAHRHGNPSSCCLWK